MGADLLVTDDSCVHTYSIQAKANSKPANFWLVGEKARKLVSPRHVYVLVNLRNGGKDKGKHEYYVVPSRDVTPVGYASEDTSDPAHASPAKLRAEKYWNDSIDSVTSPTGARP